jgi:phage gp36-like protein
MSKTQAYTAVKDMVLDFGEKELIQLTDIERSGTINDTKINSSINDATLRIDSYLINYETPVALPAGVLNKICRDISRYFLYNDCVPEHVLRAYNDQMDYLKAIASGKIKLKTTAGQDKDNASDSVICFNGDDRVVSRERRGFV